MDVAENSDVYAILVKERLESLLAWLADIAAISRRIPVLRVNVKLISYRSRSTPASSLWSGDCLNATHQGRWPATTIQGVTLRSTLWSAASRNCSC